MQPHTQLPDSPVSRILTWPIECVGRYSVHQANSGMASLSQNIQLPRPDINLFAALNSLLIFLYLTYLSQTEAGSQDSFTIDWNLWPYIYLFPPPVTSLLVWICQYFHSYSRRMLLTAPCWETQLCWCQPLWWCP